MRKLRALFLRVVGPLRGRSLGRDVDAELESHLDLHIADYIRAGMPEPEARRRALVALGGVAQTRERYRERSRVQWIDELTQDFKFATRMLTKDRGFAITVVVVLALGIGANTAIFSVVDALVLKPLPFFEPDRLVMIWEDASKVGFPENTPAPGNYFSWRERNRTFSDLAATRSASANLTVDGPPEFIMGRRVTANFFDVLGVRPLFGRTFTEEEDRTGAPVTIISYGLWQRRYRGNSDAVGQTMVMNGQRRTIIGVMPRGFVFRDRERDFWSPMAFTPEERTQRGTHFLNVVGRLLAGIGLDAARNDMARIAAELEREFPASNAETGSVVEPLRDDLLGNRRDQLDILMAASLCVLLIACANVAGLLLLRAFNRRSELAVRASMGATGARIVRQLVAEGVLLALAGAVLGLGLAPAGIRVLADMVPIGMFPLETSVLDLRVVSVTLAIALVTAVTFSLGPALHASRGPLVESLQHAGRSPMTSARLSRDSLVVAQIAVAVVLLVATGLLLRTFASLRGSEIGFEPAQLLTLRTTVPLTKYQKHPDRVAFFDRVVAQAKSLPGVQNAAYISTVPFGAIGNSAGFLIEGRSERERQDALVRIGTVDYLKTIGAELVDGRFLDGRDQESSPGVVVISETFARLHWPGGNAVRRRISLGGPDQMRTIVGVVRDIRERGYELEPKPAAYLPNTQVSGYVLPARSPGCPCVRRFDVARGATPQGDRDCRSRAADQRNPHDGRTAGLNGRRSQAADDPTGCVCLDRCAARRSRFVCRARLWRRPTQTGNCGPHGRRRERKLSAAHHCVARSKARADGSGTRAGGRLGDLAHDGISAAWRRPVRSTDLHLSRHDTVGDRRARVRSPGVARGARQSGHSASRRLSMILEEIGQDARFGLRTLRKNPGFTVVAVLSLALATGATTAIFGVINSVLLRPLPFADPDRLVQIAGTLIQRDDLEALRRASRSFESFVEYAPGTRNLQTPSGAERVTAVVSDRNLFTVLGTAPMAGRTFRRDDQSVAVISERLWRSHMSGDRSAIGKTVTLDNQTFTVIGVMPAAFQFPYGAASILRSAMTESRVDVWIAEYRPLRSRVGRLVARLKAGVLPSAAAAELSVVEDRRAKLSPAQQRVEPLRLQSYADAVFGPTRRALWLLFGAVALVLVAACANVANLLLALAGTRVGEVATRAALGASRSRLVRQFMVESLLLAIAGGFAGVLVARWTGGLLVAFAAQRIPRADEITLDWTVFGFLSLVCVATAVLFGLVPSLAAGRVDAGIVSRASGRATTGRGYGRLRDALVIAEIALAFVLASGAGIVIAEIERLRRAEDGMNTTNVVTIHLGQPMAPGVELQYYEIADRVSRLPNVSAAGFTQVLPLQNWGWNSVSTDFLVTGAPPRNEPPFAIELRYVTPGYFDALEIQIRRGRGILPSDTRNAPPVILINETLARRYFGDEDPVGVVMNRGQIVGVVADVSQVGLDRPAVPEIYYPMAQNWSQVAELGVTLVVRSTADPAALIDAVRARVREVNSQIAVFNPRTMEEVVSDSLWTLDLYRSLIGWFAALTLVLAAVGLYGVISHGVTARRREWAVRLALGSSPAEVARMVLGRGVLLSAIGILSGGVLTLIAVRVLASTVPAIADAPISVLPAVTTLLFGIALCASWLPALRVARITPASALKTL